MAIEESTGSLIGSDKVEGTAVYGANNEKIGSIERVMIDKTSGQVAYAVLSFGGFLGIGDDHYPVPWNTLRYDTDLGGYRTLISGNRLRQALQRGGPEFDPVDVRVDAVHRGFEVALNAFTQGVVRAHARLRPA